MKSTSLSGALHKATLRAFSQVVKERRPWSYKDAQNRNDAFKGCWSEAIAVAARRCGVTYDEAIQLNQELKMVLELEVVDVGAAESTPPLDADGSKDPV